MNFSRKNIDPNFIPNIISDLGKLFADDFQVKFNEARNKKADCNNGNGWSNEFVAKTTTPNTSGNATNVTANATKMPYVPAVNIKETATTFELAVIAPGLRKEDFALSIEDNILKISSEIHENHQESTTENATGNTESMEENPTKTKTSFSRTEFVQTKFSRSFELPQSIDKELISAKYDAGILYITLPKKAKINETRKVEIA